jgi:hypothetical protein
MQRTEGESEIRQYVSNHQLHMGLKQLQKQFGQTLEAHFYILKYFRFVTGQQEMDVK